MRIAPDAAFLFELRECNIHLGSIVVVANKWQYYHILFLDKRHHRQIVGRINQNHYINNKIDNGFHIVPRENYHKRRKPYFILILDKEYDHFLPEITVVNNLQNHPYALQILNSIPFREIAQEMLGNNYDQLKSDGRANNRIDIAFTPLNQRDKTILEGQNLPTITTAPNCISEFVKGENPNTTIVGSGCLVRMLSDYFCNGSGQKCFFRDQNRYNIFGKKMESTFNLPPGSCLHEGTSVHQCGFDKYYQPVFTRRHVDRGNQHLREDVEGNYEANVGLNRWVEVDYGGGHVETVRCGFNIYGKACCGGPMIRRAKVDDFINDVVKPWVTRNPDRMEFAETTYRFSGGNEFSFIPPKANKRNFYSIFMDVMVNEVGPRTDWNKAILMEGIYAITFITCPKTWVIGIRYALDKVKDGKKMFLLNFIEGILDKYGKTGGGEGKRRQPSRNKASMHTIVKSLMNFDSAIKLANQRNPGPKTVLNRMSGSWKQNGIFGARKLLSTEMMVLATMIGLIERPEYALYAEISETETKDRLKDFEIKTEAELADLVRIVAIEFCGGCVLTAENLICEVLRERKKGKKGNAQNAFDTMMKGQYLYDIANGYLVRKSMKRNAKWTQVSLGPIGMNNNYTPYLEWWKWGSLVLEQKDIEIPIRLNK